MFGVYEDVSSLGRERQLVAEFSSRDEAEAERDRLQSEFAAEVERERRFDECSQSWEPLTEWQADRHYFVERRSEVEHEGSIYRD